MSAGPVGTPYGVATDYGDAVVRYVMHGDCPPLPLTQALRDERETLSARVAELEDAINGAPCLATLGVPIDCDEDALCYSCGARAALAATKEGRKA